MTVIFSRKCELGIQAVLFLSAQKKGEYFNSGQIAEELERPKEFVSKVLQLLTNYGMVGSKKGKFGGFYLEKDPKNIRLFDIVKAIDGEEVFHKCVLGFKHCSPDKPCPVHNKWGELRDKTEQMLRDETLAELRDKTIKKLETL
jgi:Rrf2 family iron-sulfur cluster assembly transcriptional regulator